LPPITVPDDAGAPPGALLLFALYLAGIIAIGLFAARRARGDEEDYFLGGRRMSPLVVALSAVSSGRSAWLVLGATGAAWSHGTSALWLFPGYIVAELWMFLSLGPRLRALSVRAQAITIPEVLSAGCAGDAGARRAVRRTAAVVILAFTVTYVGAQLLAGGKTLDAVLGLGDASGSWSLLATAGVVTAYTLLGGYRAVAFTDVAQASFMVIGLVVLPVLGVIHFGGLEELRSALRTIDPALLDPSSQGLLYAIGGLAIGLGSPGQPAILVRHMSLADPARARIAAWTGTAWNVVLALGALLTGLIGRALYPTLANLPGGDREQLYATLSRDLSAEILFAGFAGVLLATLFAAVMSTCDSQLLVVGSSLSRDLDKDQADPQRKGSRLGARISVLVAVVVALVLGTLLDELVFGFVLLAWAALGAAFGPLLAVQLYAGPVRAGAAVAAIVVGAGGTWIWWYFARPPAMTWQLAPLCVAALATAWMGRSRGATSSRDLADGEFAGDSAIGERCRREIR